MYLMENIAKIFHLLQIYQLSNFIDTTVQTSAEYKAVLDLNGKFAAANIPCVNNKVFAIVTNWMYIN